ncbi:hypothetical protein DEAC_c40730 [Desulfosporosinus acididurans]|uniref:Single cache domain-containing protein n=1 Tax=Desulfosporosinus acididurans TaxID=476652 RepID=A0A0J1FKS0_9FIRM|nr:cache domain-containing protein [Desulfosporosinus acididurans]KLU64079.1 hypothetical protein DEAC_c40730 [Desulfosporosinus acididurans]
MQLKKWLISAAIVFVMISLTGCAKNQQLSTSTPLPTSAQPMEGHPAEDSDTVGDKGSQQAVESKINDWLTKNYPGNWNVVGTALSKGNYIENGHYKLVDGIETLFQGTMGVSIFVGEERISSSVKKGSERVLKGFPTPEKVGEVLKSGKATSSLSSGYLKVYIPFQAGGKTVAVLTVSVPHQ